MLAASHAVLGHCQVCGLKPISHTGDKSMTVLANKRSHFSESSQLQHVE